MNKEITISFDYELFFMVKNNSLDNDLINPTKLLLNELRSDKYNIIFYIDATMILFFLRNHIRFYQELNLVKIQLEQIFKKNIEIGLHLHAHWLDAKYDDNGIYFTEFANYDITKLSLSEVKKIMNESYNALVSIIGNDLKITRFRSGGLIFQPFDKIKCSLSDLKINIDSSIAPNIFLSNNDSIIDNRYIKSYEKYKFSTTPLLPDAFGEFIEEPIYTYKANIFYKILNFILKNIDPPVFYSRGDHFNPNLKGLKSRNNYRYFTIDTIHPLLFRLIYINSNSDFINIIAHPKECSSWSIKNIKFLNKNVK